MFPKLQWSCGWGGGENDGDAMESHEMQLRCQTRFQRKSWKRTASLCRVRCGKGDDDLRRAGIPSRRVVGIESRALSGKKRGNECYGLFLSERGRGGMLLFR